MAKIVETTEVGYNWKSGEEDSVKSVSVEVVDDDGNGYSVFFYEGEPEDFTFNRDLNSAFNIYNIVRKAYELGRSGVEVEFERVEEKDDD